MNALEEASGLAGARGVDGASGLDGAPGLRSSPPEYGPRRREFQRTTEGRPKPYVESPPNFVRLHINAGISNTVDASPPDGSSASYSVVVSDGGVCEHLMAADVGEDAMLHHFCPSRLTNSFPTEFPIRLGQAIYIRVYMTDSGVIGLPDGVEEGTPPVDLMVARNDKVSLNYIPGKQAGIAYYKLAELLPIDGGVYLKPYYSGSIIDHYSGITCDAVLEDCSGDPVLGIPGEIVQRLSFNRGFLVALNKSYAERTLAPNHSVETVAGCCNPT